MTGEQLKKSILQYAIEGKLVPQDDKEEPASILIEKIREEKERLIKEKVIKRDKEESFIYRKDGSFYEKIGKEEKCIDDELPFDIPDSWEWARLGNIINFKIGKTPKRVENNLWESGVYPWVSIADMISDGIIKETKEKVSEKAYHEVFGGNISKKGTLIMSFKLTIGRVSILDIDTFHNEAIISIYPLYDKKNIFRNYLMKILPLISESGNSKSAIKGKTLNSESIKTLLIPIPSLLEQERIVAKIEEVLAKVEKLKS